MYSPEPLQAAYLALRDASDALVQRSGAWSPLLVLGAAALVVLLARRRRRPSS